MPRKGDFLLSEPFMKDPSFKRAVILLCEHNQTGSFGFILNKISDFSVQELILDFPAFDAPVYLGGPVGEDTLHFLHRCGPILENSIKVRENIWWGGNFEQLKEEIRNGNIFPDDIRFFIGYSGWGVGQLKSEMDDNSWIISDKYTDFYGESADLWKTIMHDMGGNYKLLSNFPEDPQLN
ncbi:MAG: YqgE/AlgH family protein [Bacteroidetes bacterium]|jgi:putative transcriptional regulator|nr:YqgE/AlgH family protein [Bacteroidota bacterium]MBP7255622.1 YqgE/AlgH family protein [Chitinophagales bacterium]MBK7504622.1 YqgE/AlgH family protein [Bacteroidota bacterium]MBK7640096.1 YqgE/AlgH family protein [Bacteroidota bacterium]MBK8671562.1 YqgE/AlgH family protein [Bacteroidota bacterium]